MSSFVELGKVVGVWGVKGWLKLHSYTRDRIDIANYSTWWLQTKKQRSKPQRVVVLTCREQGQGIVAQLEGIDDRDQAVALIGQRILVEESDLPMLPEGEYYWQQLIGLTVSNAEQEIGVVESILETGANDVLVVKPVVTENNKTTPEVLIPYIEQAVKEVDVHSGTMLVDWDPSYLLEN